MPNFRYEIVTAMADREPFVLAVWVLLTLLTLSFAGACMVGVTTFFMDRFDPVLVGVCLYAAGYEVGRNRNKPKD
jgi:hypothetical protein